MAALDFLRFFMAPPLTAATGGSDEEIRRSIMLTAGALAPAASRAGGFGARGGGWLPRFAAQQPPLRWLSGGAPPISPGRERGQDQSGLIEELVRFGLIGRPRGDAPQMPTPELDPERGGGLPRMAMSAPAADTADGAASNPFESIMGGSSSGAGGSPILDYLQSQGLPSLDSFNPLSYFTGGGGDVASFDDYGNPMNVPLGK